MKKLMAVLLMLAVTLCAGSAMAEEPIKYVEYTWNKTAKTLTSAVKEVPEGYTSVSGNMSDGGWYVVTSDKTISDRITVSGAVNLVLCDNATLTAETGITVSVGNTLTIYGQRDGSGKLIATSEGGSNGVGSAGIGGADGGAGGTVAIHGGNVTATGNGGAGIGGGSNNSSSVDKGHGGMVTIYGGTVVARSNYQGAGIGGGNYGDGGSVTIHGGHVTATGEMNAAGIGGGTSSGAGGTVTITGGTVVATGDAGGAGIGGCSFGNGGMVIITGGNVKATGDDGAEDIGKGEYGSSGSLTDGKGEQVMLHAIELGSAYANTAVSSLKDSDDNETGYGLNDVKVMDDGMLYVYLPTTDRLMVQAGNDSAP